MMGGVSPETSWASYKYEIKFWYTVTSCWISHVKELVCYSVCIFFSSLSSLPCLLSFSFSFLSFCLYHSGSCFLSRKMPFDAPWPADTSLHPLQTKYRLPILELSANEKLQAVAAIGDWTVIGMTSLQLLCGACISQKTIYLVFNWCYCRSRCSDLLGTRLHGMCIEKWLKWQISNR